MLCSNHGHYGGGLCHCEEGYKGGECEIPAGECQVPGCSGHGRCIEGECHCERGYKGHDCAERKLERSTAIESTCLNCYCSLSLSVFLFTLTV